MSSQADKHLAAARKCITKPTFSLFWKPDYDTAAQEYERAASCFKAAQLTELAITALTDAAHMWVQADSYFMAAKNTEAAAALAASVTNHSIRAATLYKQAADYFVVNATPDRAAESLEKAAKHAEDAGDFKLALDLFREATELHTGEGRPRFAIDVNKHAVAFAIRANLSTETIELLQQQIQLYSQLSNTNGISKSTLSLILYLLSLGDTVAANSAFDNGMMLSHLARDEAIAASNMLDAINAADQELITKAANAQIISFLDQPIIRAARSISTETTLPLAQPASVTPGTVPIPGFTPSQPPPTVIPGFTSHPSSLSAEAPPPPAIIPGFTPSATSAIPPAPIPGFTPGDAEAPSTDANPKVSEDDDEEEGIC